MLARRFRRGLKKDEEKSAQADNEVGDIDGLFRAALVSERLDPDVLDCRDKRRGDVLLR